MLDSSSTHDDRPFNPRRTMTRRALTAGVIVGASLLSAACTGTSAGSGSLPATDSSPAITTTSAPATSSAAGGPSGATISANVGSSGGTAMCVESQLKATVDFQHPAGTVNDQYHPVIVYFQNTSSSACVITGYPGAAVVDDQGRQVVEATRAIRGNALGLPSGQAAVPVVTLQPGKYASAGLEGVSTKETGAAQAGCSTSAYPGILVTPPNTTIPVPFTVSWPNCFTFEVHPVNVEHNPPSS